MTQSKFELKGSLEGYRLTLRQTESLDGLNQEILKELSRLFEEDLDGASQETRLKLTVDTGQILLNEAQEASLVQAIESKYPFDIQAIESALVTREEAQENFTDQAIYISTGNLRGGQEVEATMDLLHIGNVHPGAILKAGRNIYVLGAFAGLAIAGLRNGVKDPIIVAKFDRASQIRIGQAVHVIEAEEGRESFDAPYQAAFINDLNVFEFQLSSELKNSHPGINEYLGGYHG